MRSGGKGNGLPMGNDRGTGPATSVSPDALANEQSRSDKFLAVARTIFSSAAAIELTQQDYPSLGSEATEDDGTTEIQDTFRRMLMGLRQLPRQERAQALRAAQEWRLYALNAVREKRARDRYARYMLWRLKRPAPRQPG